VEIAGSLEIAESGIRQPLQGLGVPLHYLSRASSATIRMI
jgi:hypothetical protein